MMRKQLILLFFVVTFTQICCFSAQAQIFNSKKYKKENAILAADKAKLERQLDSMRNVLQQRQRIIDSLSTPVEVSADQFDITISDSLLRVWYIHQNEVHSTSYDMEVEHFTSNVTDEEFVRRFNAMNSFLPLTFNEVVKNYCILYSEKLSDRMSTLLGKMHYYWPLFDEILSAHKLPLELKTLVVVESFLKPTAVSRVGATGLWQFMYRTARGYGMRIDSWTDERMDPIRSTECAARFLSDSYKLFGDWYLVLAAYNCGAGNVQKAIRRSGGKRDFWEIYDYLPKETRGYVPAFIGAQYAIYYYKEYGIKPQASVLSVPIDTFIVHKNLHFGQLEGVLGVSSATVAEMNPQYMHSVVPGSEYPCVLRLPMEYTNAFIDNQDSLYVYQKDKFFDPAVINKIKEATPAALGSGNKVVHKVKSGEVLGKIASRYGVTVAQIKKWNSLKSDRINVGQKLTIYRKK